MNFGEKQTFQFIMLTKVFFLVQNTSVSHCIWWSPLSFSLWKFFSLGFPTFEEHWLVILSDVFSWLGWIYGFLQEYQRNDVLSFSVQHIMRYMLSICIITSGINFEYLIKGVSARFLSTVNLLFFPFVVNKYLVFR